MSYLESNSGASSGRTYVPPAIAEIDEQISAKRAHLKTMFDGLEGLNDRQKSSRAAAIKR